MFKLFRRKRTKKNKKLNKFYNFKLREHTMTRSENIMQSDFPKKAGRIVKKKYMIRHGVSINRS
jgi:hypothetical protein